jgi:hypothetical protein
MRTQRRVAAVFLACATAGGARWALAQDPAEGKVSLGGESATFSTALGFWNPLKNRVSVALFSAKPPGGVEEASRRAGRWDVASLGPTVVMDLDFVPGTTSAVVGQLASCRVAFSGFRSRLELKGSAKECAIQFIGGLLGPEGAVVGVLQGQGKAYSFRLPFSAAFGASSVPVGGDSTASASPAASPAIPPGTASGSASFAGQRRTFTQGLAWWNAEKNEVNVALFDHAPPPGILADLRSGSWGEGGPGMTLQLRFTAGAPLAASGVDYCYVGVSFPKGGPIGKNTNARGCGFSELGGDAKAGGNVTARLRGEDTGPGDKPYSWEAGFNLPIAE